jgi:hypothetical protein
MWVEIQESKAGICPKCDSENIDYGVAEIGEAGVMYPFLCNNCGFYGQEWYNLEFSAIWEKED